MPIDLHRIMSTTDFLHNAKTVISEVESKQQPLILTTVGKARIVLLDIDTFQQLWFHENKLNIPQVQTPAQADLPKGVERADVAETTEVILKRRRPRP